MAQCEFIKDMGMILPTETSPKKYRYFLVRCGNCQKEFATQARFYKKGGVKSCRECSSGLRDKSIYHRKHGLRNHPLYEVWCGIKNRCKNKSHIGFENYGGKSVSICQEWENDFKAFYDWSVDNGYKKGLDIDRIDNDGNYEPSNCRYVTREINMTNQRPIQKNNTSGYRGVFKYGKTNRFYARIRINGENVILGVFDKPEDASAAYEKAFADKRKQLENTRS